MTWMVKFQPNLGLILPALLALGIDCHSVSAATPVLVKNAGPTPVQIGFDGGRTMTMAPRDTARISLDVGDHTSQCRFEGNYDGCNIDERFTFGATREVTFSLRPMFTLAHAVALAQQGTLRVETRRDMAWAATTLDVPGTALDCSDYGTGKLGAVSKRVQSGLPIRNITLATQNLCGEPTMVVGATIDGAQHYFQLRFLTFRDAGGRPVLVRQ